MEAKELRIGNWVSYENRDFQIHSLSEELPTLDTMEFGIGVVDWNNLSPIPITPDWLKWFRFKEDGGNFYLNSQSTGDSMGGIGIIYFDHNLYKKNEKWYYFMGSGDDIELKYIHQLQNLMYALTGEEL